MYCCAASVPEYNLTGEFCRKHFLTGLLLRELGLALQDEQDLRHLALSTLKTLMAKHSLDARYATKVAEHSHGKFAESGVKKKNIPDARLCGAAAGGGAQRTAAS